MHHLMKNKPDADGESYNAYEAIENDSSSDEKAISSDISENIKDALEKLSPQQKMVFSLKHFEEYKIKEIARNDEFIGRHCEELFIQRYS